MTIPEHVEILRRGPRTWNAWRAENPSIVPDLSGIALSIGDRQMGPINGGPINLSRALMSDAAFYYATLTGADMRGSDLTNADLRGARLEEVDLTGADLAGAQLDGAALRGAVLTATNLCGASLADAQGLTSEQIGEAEGDLGTVLPSDMARPPVWSVGQEYYHVQKVAVQDETASRNAASASHEVSPMRAREESTFTATPQEAPGDRHAPVAESHRANGREAWPSRGHTEEPVTDTSSDVPLARSQMNWNAAPALPTAAPREKAERPTQAAVPVPEETQPLIPAGHTERGLDHSEAAGHGAGQENKHVSWLVGGPRRAGRPARNWRDRA